MGWVQFRALTRKGMDPRFFFSARAPNFHFWIKSDLLFRLLILILERTKINFRLWPISLYFFSLINWILKLQRLLKSETENYWAKMWNRGWLDFEFELGMSLNSSFTLMKPFFSNTFFHNPTWSQSRAQGNNSPFVSHFYPLIRTVLV